MQNGNYPDPSLTSALPIKRQFRDPHADWWDKQERRNYGEPVHEDNDILGIFSPEEYTHFKPGWGAVLLGTFIGSVGVLCAVISRYYPDRVRYRSHASLVNLVLIINSQLFHERSKTDWRQNSVVHVLDARGIRKRVMSAPWTDVLYRTLRRRHVCVQEVLFVTCIREA